MIEHKTEIIAGVVAILSSITTLLFARRKSNAEADNTLAEGVSKIVETSNKLLDMTTKSLIEEKQYHIDCRKRVEALERKLEELEKRI